MNSWDIQWQKGLNGTGIEPVWANETPWNSRAAAAKIVNHPENTMTEMSLLCVESMQKDDGESRVFME